MLPSQAIKTGKAHDLYHALVYCYHCDWPRSDRDIAPMRQAYAAIRERLLEAFPTYRYESLSPLIDFCDSGIPIEVQIQIAVNAGQ